MKILTFAIGSRGDVEPGLIVSAALRDRGHDVRLVAPSDQIHWIERSGVSAVALPQGAKSVLNSADVQDSVRRSGFVTQAMTMISKIKHETAAAIHRVDDAAEGADAILSIHPGVAIPAAVAAARRIPLLTISLSPCMPTRRFAFPAVTRHQLGPATPLTYKVPFNQLFRSVRPIVNAYRARNGLAPVNRSHLVDIVERDRPAAIAWSRHLLPMPDDYGAGAFQAGAINAPTDLRDATGCGGPDAALLEWIRAGDAPVFLSFGSMFVADIPRTIDAVQTALATLGLRGVFVAGWSDLPEGPVGNLYCVRQIDHQRLFPLCRVAVHHGGAGTTHAALRTGIPSLVTAFMFDQSFWGRHLARLGVGDHMVFKALTAETLAAKLAPLLEPAVTLRARRIGEALRREDGLAAIVRYTEETLPSTPPPD
ncbi:glycosyltransferase [Acuticoccus sp. M5D2P5]|uniref:glycosyltransferase n=1 Tax=Acuticoccus kalidii TaxID=2910977 RepID=UPI001F2E7125|nr:glycosyltransferase [Acuticoccus kalidii]MCF3933690.1 glycosyltransferase [Acuticoccus kalidii]